MAAIEKYDDVQVATEVEDRTRKHDVDTKENSQRSDDEVLNTAPGAKLIEGYISYMPIVQFGFALLADWEAVGLSLQLNLLNGGTSTLVYGSLLAGVGTCLIALSIAEMASMDPVVGAQYRWSARFAPGGVTAQRFWGLFQGWVTLFAWMTGATTNLAYMSQGLLSIAVLWDPGYEPKAWHNALVMCAFVVPPVVGNLWFRRLVEPMEWFGGVCHALFWLVSIVVLGAMGTRGSHASVWASPPRSRAGWDARPGVAFGVGLVPISFPGTGFDGVIHMTKETRDAPRTIPGAIMVGVVLNSLMAFVYLVVVSYYLGDVDELLADSPMGLAIMGVYLKATGNKAAATIVVLFHVVIMYISLYNIYASVARLGWAFSQNKGLPFSDFFVKISSRYNQPLRSMGLLVVVDVALAMISIGSTTAFNAILALPLVSMYISYGIPILFILLRRLRGLPLGKQGPFRLPRGVAIATNAVALVYILYIISFAGLPTMMPVTKDNMNYAGPMMLAIIFIALADWCISGRKRFRLPEVHFDS
ncbi:Choline transport protein [Apiospora arundinis]